MPDDDAGRDDLGPGGNVSPPWPNPKRRRTTSREWAPGRRGRAFSSRQHVWGLDKYERTPTAKELGERLGLTNTEREALKLWPFLPVDKTEQELAEQSKVRERERRARKRREKGIRTREAFCPNWQAKPNPGCARPFTLRLLPETSVSKDETR